MLDSLTRREHEILILVAQGLSNREIAQALFLSLGTVKTHTHNIYHKLGVTNRTQALLEAQELGLVNDAVAASESTATPSIREAQTHHLPTELTPFVGRKTELTYLADMLNDKRLRLITILGAGGMGKTRIALEVAHQHESNFRDGARFISLARLADAKNLAITIIDDLGLPFQAGEGPEQQLLYYLQDKQMLLIIDNFEHLLDGIDLLKAMLHAAPDVALLVTSRVRLNLSAEVVYVLNGLDYAVSGADADAQREAVQLFLERMQFVKPGFELQPDDWLHVYSICQLTQGMPLALILAAGWLEMLTLEEIAHELAQSIDILESQLSDLPKRQRSMRAAITSSWNRLTTEEQLAFARLCVFRGGFSRDAARMIAQLGLRTLQNLVNRSFVTADNGRYNIHELLRQFGWEQLQRLSNAGELYSAHSNYYLSWLAQLEADIKGQRQVESMREIRRDFNNIQLAWTWAIQTRQTADVEHALETIFVFSYISGRVVESLDLLQRALDGWASMQADHALLLSRIRARMYSLKIFSQLQELDLAQIEDCAAVARQHQDTFETAFAVQVLANYYLSIERDNTRAIQLLSDSLGTMQALDETYYIASICHQLGYCHGQETGLDDFLRFTEMAYHVAKESGNLYRVGAASGNLGAVALGYGQYEDAVRYYREGIDVMIEFQASWNLVHQLIAFAFSSFLAGKVQDVDAAFASGLRYAQDTAYKRGLAFAYAVQSFICATRAEYEQALEYSQQSLDETQTNSTIKLVAYLGAAMAACGLRDDAKVITNLRHACQMSLQLDYAATLTWALPVMVIQAVRDGELEQAVQWLALLRTHPASAKDWLSHWALFAQTEAHLEQALEQTHYQKAWQQGTSLELAGIADFFTT